MSDKSIVQKLLLKEGQTFLRLDVKTDVNRDILREIVVGFGFETVALFSVDETWSAMRLKVV